MKKPFAVVARIAGPLFVIGLFGLFGLIGLSGCSSCARGFDQGFCQGFHDNFLRSCVSTCAARAGAQNQARCETLCAEALPRESMYASRCLTNAAGATAPPGTPTAALAPLPGVPSAGKPAPATATGQK